MIDPMIKALAASTAKDNNWPYAEGTSSDGKKLEFIAFKIKGMNIFIEEGATMKVFPVAAASKLKEQINEYMSKQEQKDKDILSQVKMLKSIFGKEEIT